MTSRYPLADEPETLLIPIPDPGALCSGGLIGSGAHADMRRRRLCIAFLSFS